MDSNTTVVKAYQPRPNCMKPESANPHTIRHRKYIHVAIDYYRKNSDVIKSKVRDRYKNDEEYRQRCIERARASYQRRKQQKAAEDSS